MTVTERTTGGAVQLAPDPGGARWAVAAAALGTAANGLLVGFYALVPTAGPGNPLGPANDLVGSAASAAMIPVVLAVGRRLPPGRGARRLTRVAVAALAGGAVAGPALVAGVLPFPVATAVGVAEFVVLVVWIAQVSRWLGAARLLPPGTARLGTWIGAAALTGAGLAAAAQLLPVRSMPQYAVLGTGVALGVAAFLAVPAWFWLVGRWLARPRV